MAVLNATEAATISRSLWLRRLSPRMFTPTTTIIPNMKIKVPPRTNVGTMLRINPIFGTRAITTRSTLEIAKTNLLPTPVKEIAPTF